jgi:hypothetical protein
LRTNVLKDELPHQPVRGISGEGEELFDLIRVPRRGQIPFDLRGFHLIGRIDGQLAGPHRVFERHPEHAVGRVLRMRGQAVRFPDREQPFDMRRAEIGQRHISDRREAQAHHQPIRKQGG